MLDCKIKHGRDKNKLRKKKRRCSLVYCGMLRVFTQIKKKSQLNFYKMITENIAG